MFSGDAFVNKNDYLGLFQFEPNPINFLTFNDYGSVSNKMKKFKEFGYQKQVVNYEYLIRISLS